MTRPAARAPWWLRLHAALMPDYGARAAACWWLLAAAALGVLVHHLAQLGSLSALAWLQVGLAAAFAVGVGLCPIRLPGTRQSFTAGEIFIFLLLLVQGVEAAALASALEAAAGAWRTSRRWTSRLISPAVALLSMTLTGSLLAAAAPGLQALAGAVVPGPAGGAPVLVPAAWAGLPAPALLSAMLLMAALNFTITAQLLAGLSRLKRGEPWLRGGDLSGVLHWVGLAYLGSAVVAALMFVAWRLSGHAVLMAVLPVLVMLIVSLHFYFVQQEAASAMRQSAARAAEQARQHLLALQASERRFHSAFTHAAIGMALLSPDGSMLQANPALRRLLGLADEEALPARFQSLVEEEFRRTFTERLRPTGPGQSFQDFQLELRCRRRDGQALWALVHCGWFIEPRAEVPAEPQSDDPDHPTVPPEQRLDAASGFLTSHLLDTPMASGRDSRFSRFGPDSTLPGGQGRLILQLQDISARRQAEAGLHRLAFHDSLTGLPNRRQFMDSLANAVQRHQADPQAAYALLYLDFDRFKLVNDSLGHKAGDELLVQLARRIQDKLRPSDVVARLSGDEFAVLVPQLLAEHDAVQLAQRLVEALRRPFQVEGHALFTSASIGITFSRFGYQDADAALHDADTAMYQAKAAGKGCYRLFDGRVHGDTLPGATVAQELRLALDRGELHLAYQPVVALADGRLSGFEALVRWQHPTVGLMAPATFLPAAEESGLITPLTDFVLDCACAQLAQWQRLGPAWAGLTMCVNLSGHELASRQLPERVHQALLRHGLQPAHLVLELTEEAMMGQFNTSQDNLGALRALGVRLSVDDFGTGYSSLSRLARLPIDSFKIDRSFVRELTSASAAQDDQDDSAVVRALVQMGGALGKSVVAEGIETAQQADQLRRMHPELLGQGFHLAEPLSAADATDWLRARPERSHALH